MIGSWERTAPGASPAARSGCRPRGTAWASAAPSWGSTRGSTGGASSSPFPRWRTPISGSSPGPGGASVGIAYTPGRLTDSQARAALDRFLDDHLDEGWRDLPGPRYRYPIPVFGPWTLEAVRRGSGCRVLLAGDAAAVADPLTREGIRYGLLTGLWAAESLLAGRPQAYAERLESGLLEEMEEAGRGRAPVFEGA